MGEVWRATDSRLKRDVAIKVLPDAFVADRDRLARFEREAQLLAQLHHPNVASIFGLEESDGARALVMELVAGPTLAERLAQGRVPVEEAVAIATGIARALEAAHEKGIVHRDLKPQNVKLAPDGTVKVLDFGLAKAMDAADAGLAPDLARSPTMLNSPTLTAAHGTQLGVILGTAAYMAPEQARGAAVDRRADIWAFGVVLYEMLSGRSPFLGETVSDTLAGVLKTELDFGALPAATPAELRRLLRRCLERNPKNRLHDVADARIVLEEIASGREAEKPAAPLPPERRRAGLAFAAALALLAAVAAFALGRKTAAPTAAAPSAATGFIQITDMPGIETSPSLSPDGRDIVFTRVVDGRSEILIQRVGARTSTSLTGSSGVSDRQPAFSPDGARIAFRSERDGGGIFVMDVSGESVRKIVDSGYNPTWSPDGREIAAANGDYAFASDRGGAARGLFAVDVASGSRREISREGDVMQPAWSPHGRRIAFWGLKATSGQRDISTVAADGSEVETTGKVMIDDPPLDWSPQWSPDGKYLYFSSNRGGTMNLWRVAIDEASGETRGLPEPVTTPSLWAGNISFTRDGKRFAFSSLDWRTTLWRAELDAAHAKIGTPVPMLEGTLPIRDHSLSPDGELVAFSRHTAQADIYVARIDGSHSRRVTDDEFRDRSPGWSPDGERLVFYTDRGGKYEIWTIRPDGSDARQVTEDKSGTANFPSWSPDGRTIAFSRIPGGGQLIDVGGQLPASGTKLPETGLPDTTFWPTGWSSDSRKLAGILVRGAGTVYGIGIYDLASKSYWTTPFGVAEGWRYVLFLGDDRRLIVRDLRGIWLVDPAAKAGSEPVRLVSIGGYTIGKSVGLSHDQRWLTWSQTGTEGDVWIAELGGAAK